MTKMISEKSVFAQKYADSMPKDSGVIVATSIAIMFIFLNRLNPIVVILVFCGLSFFIFKRLSKKLTIEDNINKDYESYLKNMPLEVLVIAATSLELSEESRGAIVEYLNKNHEGWSFRP